MWPPSKPAAASTKAARQAAAATIKRFLSVRTPLVPPATATNKAVRPSKGRGDFEQNPRSDPPGPVPGSTGLRGAPGSPGPNQCTSPIFWTMLRNTERGQGVSVSGGRAECQPATASTAGCDGGEPEHGSPRWTAVPRDWSWGRYRPGTPQEGCGTGGCPAGTQDRPRSPLVGSPGGTGPTTNPPGLHTHTQNAINDRSTKCTKPKRCKQHQKLAPRCKKKSPSSKLKKKGKGCPETVKYKLG